MEMLHIVVTDAGWVTEISQ